MEMIEVCLNRKIKLLNGNTHSFFIKGERNPCGCGSNCFHKEDDNKHTYGVCNACGKDVYVYNEREEFKEYKTKS